MALNIRPLMYARNGPALLFLTFSLVINIYFIIRTGYIICKAQPGSKRKYRLLVKNS